MRIETIGRAPGARAVDPEPVIGLQRRLEPPPRPDPVNEAFYTALQHWQGSGHTRVHDFISAYATATGERPYASNAARMALLQSVLQRMKDEGLGDSELYRQTYAAFATAFSTKAFMDQFTQQVFDPQALADEDEDTTW